MAMKKLCITITPETYEGLETVAGFLDVEIEDLIREYIIHNAEILRRFKEKAKAKWGSYIKT